MPTKNQAKVVLDLAVTQIKSDIDNTLPVGVNIADGDLAVNPIHWTLVLDAGGVYANAKALALAIIANLDTQLRSYTIDRFRRESDGDISVVIITQLANYRIKNIGTTSGEIL